MAATSDAAAAAAADGVASHGLFLWQSQSTYTVLQVVNESLALEVLLLLLESPSDDSVEVASNFLMEVSQRMSQPDESWIEGTVRSGS